MRNFKNSQVFKKQGIIFKGKFYSMAGLSTGHSLLKFFCGLPKGPRAVVTRKDAEKTFLRATKVGMKAGNHYRNASRASKKVLVDDEFITSQLIRAEMRKQNCLFLIGRLKEFFDGKPKSKVHKSQILNVLLEDLAEQMGKLEQKINKLKAKKGIVT